MTLIGYHCPHCSRDVSVEDNLFGETIDCPRCGKPFIPEPPSAKPADGGRALDNPDVTVTSAADDEEVLLVRHPAMFRNSPMVFFLYAALLLAGLAGVIAGLLFSVAMLAVGGLLFLASIAVAAVGGVLLFVWWVQTRFTTLTVTNQRTRLTKGIISRDSTEVQHDDVRNLQVDQSVWGRIVGCGDFAVSSSGQDDLEVVVHGIPNPEEVAEVVRNRQ